MKFSCAKDVILSAANTAAKAASQKSTIPALEGILLELDNNLLTITGYNLEIGIRTEINVENGENGGIIIDAKMFTDIIRKMPSGVLEFDIGSDNVAKISKGNTELSVMCMKADDYPPIPQNRSDTGFDMPQGILKSMISQTKYACATNDNKPALTGCFFNLKNKQLDVVAVDGVRIARRIEPVDYDNISFIVPVKALDEVIKLISDDNEKKVKIRIDKNQISFEFENIILISRLINGDFMEYEKHFICDDSITAEIKCREIIEVLDRALLFVNEKNKVPLRCEFNGDQLIMTCTTPMGRISDKIQIKYNGEPIEIGFNVKFLLDAFRAIDSDTVKLILTSKPVSPVIMVPMEGREFMSLLLPMRLK